MKMNAGISNKRDRLYQDLIKFCPDFAQVWDDPDSLYSLFRYENGSFSVCGLFMDFGRYVYDHLDRLSEQTTQSLFSYIEECMNSSDPEINNEVGAGFLEHFDRQSVEKIEPYLGSKTKAFLSAWCG
ncbi:MAG: hypothetical protein JOZ57_00300 [Abitibacteriaceae bacterium]|nr:hypothetical protein [Abditibacteriaceae bacterium]